MVCGRIWGVKPGSTARCSGESHIWDAHRNWTNFIYMGRQPSSGRALSAQPWIPVQNIYKTCTSLRNPNHDQPHFRDDSAAKNSSKTHSRGASTDVFFRRFFAKGDASLLMHHFRTVFRPFSLWSGPQYPVMHHFLGNCTALAAPFGPTAAPPKDHPSAIEMMIGSPPEKLYKISPNGHFGRHGCARSAHPRPPRKATLSYECIPNQWRTFIYFNQRQHRGRPAIRSPADAPGT